MSARERIVDRVRAACERRERREHPGPFQGWRPKPTSASPVDGLTSMLQSAGAEVVSAEGMVGAGKWVRSMANDFESVSIGVTVPAELRPMVTTRGSHEAELGVSMARAAIAETGSLLMDARDGRRTQLLVPTHVVFVRATNVHATFREALASVRDDLPSAIGLHSGPSKSADIAQTLVEGVHGPGRLVVVVIE
jgi:L-lactate dehydrogenase complex protein LldG